MKEVTTSSKTGYRTLFTLGIIFTGAGIAIGLAPMMMLGFVFMIVGLVNRDKWSMEEKPEENKEIQK
jgi:Na+-transporting methylmalonyl-CoA/oxaloacetate decarboxylase gamma subunit